MSTTTDPPSEHLTASRVLEIFQSASKPITLKQARQQYKGPELSEKQFRTQVDALVAEQKLFESSPQGSSKRFWGTNEKKLARDALATILEAKPLKKDDLVIELGKKLRTGASRSWREKFIDEQVAEGTLFLWPPVGRYRSNRFSMSPAEPAEYLKKSVEELAKVCKKLSKANFETKAILLTACRAIEPKFAAETAVKEEDEGTASGNRPNFQPPTDEAERDFYRDVSEFLVFAWQDAESEETQQALEGVLFNMSVQRIGEPGEKVSFDGRIHHTKDALFPGDTAEVVQSGWRLEDGEHRYLIARAQVRGAGA